MRSVTLGHSLKRIGLLYVPKTKKSKIKNPDPKSQIQNVDWREMSKVSDLIFTKKYFFTICTNKLAICSNKLAICLNNKLQFV